MIWLDLLAVAIVIGAAFAESKRQFGSTLLDMLALLAATQLAKLLGPRLGSAVTLLSAPDDNRALAMAVLFVLFGGFLLTLAKLTQGAMLLSLEAFDGITGAICGLVSGVAVANLLLIIILTANPAATNWGAAARKRPAVRELVYFRSYHAAVYWLRHTGEVENYTPPPRK